MDESRPPSQDSHIAFCLEIGKALHSFGTPAHRFEEAMQRLVASLGLEGDFLAHPTAFFAELRSAAGREVFMVRAEPGETNLEKLVSIQALVKEVIQGNLPIEEAAARVREVVAQAPRFGKTMVGASFGLSSGMAARFFGGGWREMLLAAMLGVFIFLLGSWTSKHHHLAQVLVLLAAALAGFGGVVAAHFIPNTAAFTITLAGIVILLPGLKLTVALREVATGNLVAGSARLVDAVMILMMLAFGVALGRQVAMQFAMSFRESPSIPLAAWTEWVALLAVPFAYLVLFQARKRDVGWILLASLVAFISSRFGSAWLGPELGAGLGAMALGIAANLFGRRTRLPNQIMELPGLLLLVPGSIGFRGLAFLTMGETEVGLQTAFRMVFLAVALVMGLSLANALVRPRKGL
ncbi:MAG: threonine/serine exporter family protein [Holophagaceae bacterium]|nr:threonine/serine exporter family protein [Holophagaceae bacterium]